MEHNDSDAPADQFKTGDPVPSEAEYVCVPCGYRQRLTPGNTFPQCVDCLSDEDRVEMAEGQELWEKVEE